MRARCVQSHQHRLVQHQPCIRVACFAQSNLNRCTDNLALQTFGEQNTEAEAHEMLSLAADAGVNFLVGHRAGWLRLDGLRLGVGCLVIGE